MVDVVEEVAIRLTADGTEALETADRIADEIEEKGAQAGEKFAEGFAGVLEAEAGQIVRQAAEAIGVTFERMAAAIQLGPQPFQAFDAEQLAEFATVLSDIEVPLGRVGEKVELTSRELEVFSATITGQAIPAVKEEIDLFEQIMAAVDEMGIVLDKQGVAKIKAMVEEMEGLNEEGGEFQEIFAEVKVTLLEQVEDMALVEGQVKKVVDAYREMGVTIPDALQRDKIRNHIRALQDHADQFSDVKGEANRFTDAIINQGKRATEGGSILKRLGGIAQGLGFSMGGLVTGIGAATVAFKILSGVIKEIREATQFALRFTDTTRDLTAAIRVNSIAGQENTMTYREWVGVADEVARITGVEMAASFETVSATLRELGAGTGLTDAQMQEFLVTGAKFAEIYGEELPGGIRKLTQFITTGYSQALQQLGLDLGKEAQNLKAMNMRLGTNIDKLSESQQEMVRFSLIMEELEKRTEGVAIETDTFADRLDRVEQQTERARKTLGDLFVPVTVKMKEFWANVKTGFAGLVGIIVVTIQKMVATAVSNLLALAASIQFIFDNIGKAGFWEKMEQLPGLFEKARDEAFWDIWKTQTEAMTGAIDELEQSAEGAAGAIGELGEELGVTAEQLALFIDQARKFDEGMEKIARKLQQSIDDIEESFRKRRARAEVDFQRDMRDIDRDAAIDRLEAIRDFQIDEIRMREDHRLDIRQLEERFLLDLEDAVRDRDARQVLQLQRRFNLEKKQREEDFNLRTKRRREDLGFELQQIQRDRALRRQERLAAFREEIMDSLAMEEERKAQARLRAERQEAELLEQIKNRLLALTEAAEGELGIEKEKLDALVNALTEVYGEDGPWVAWHRVAVETTQGAATGIANANQQIINNLAQTEGAIRAHLAFLQQAANQSAQLGAMIGGSRETGGGRFGGKFFTPGGLRQRGGSIFATGPTGFVAGEGRPERVDISPLSRSTGKPSAGFRGGGQDRLAIDLNVEASEMLVVEVADQTMSEVADVFVNISQRSFQGGRGA